MLVFTGVVFYWPAANCFYSVHIWVSNYRTIVCCEVFVLSSIVPVRRLQALHQVT